MAISGDQEPIVLFIQYMFDLSLRRVTDIFSSQHKLISVFHFYLYFLFKELAAHSSQLQRHLQQNMHSTVIADE